jgi:hypothetical protein
VGAILADITLLGEETGGILASPTSDRSPIANELSFSLRDGVATSTGSSTGTDLRAGIVVSRPVPRHDEESGDAGAGFDAGGPRGVREEILGSEGEENPRYKNYIEEILRPREDV